MNKFEQLIEQCWQDASVKQRFLENPKQVLKEIGYPVEEEITIEVHDADEEMIHYVLLDESQEHRIHEDADPILAAVTKRSHRDPAFKEFLLKDPKAAILEDTGVVVPGKVALHENTTSHLHIVFPANPYHYGELQDTDLVMVAGGKGGYTMGENNIDGVNLWKKQMTPFYTFFNPASAA